MSTTPPDHRPPPPGPIERWINRVVILVALPLFAWYCVARIPSQPVGPGEYPELESVMSKISELALSFEPAPHVLNQRGGMPLERPRLDEIGRLLQQASDLTHQHGMRLIDAPGIAPDVPLYDLIIHFTRNMEQLAQAGRFDAAVDCAIAAQGLEREFSSLVKTAFEPIAKTLQRYPFPSEASTRLIRALEAYEGLLPVRHYLADMQLLDGGMHQLDRHYTRTSSGDGWLVVNSIYYDYNPPEPPPSLWNITSGLFYGRAELEARMWRHIARARELNQDHYEFVHLPLGTDTTVIYKETLAGERCVSIDKPDQMLGYLWAAQRAQRRRILVVLAHLSALHHELGRWPEPNEVDRSDWPLNLDTGKPFDFEAPYVTDEGAPALDMLSRQLRLPIPNQAASLVGGNYYNPCSDGG